MFESAEDEAEARQILNRLDQDGWEAVSSSRGHGEIVLFLRRPSGTEVGQHDIGCLCDRDCTHEAD
ncbi:MAG TPA: hypothetical protein VEL79_03375 [Vicinamibacterales bacterium]|nr:hypothetical protein [Vicinamibacterales bacterium]